MALARAALALACCATVRIGRYAVPGARKKGDARRATTLSSENSFFGKRYRAALATLLSGEDDTYPEQGKRAPFEVAGPCVGLPSGFVPPPELRQSPAEI